MKFLDKKEQVIDLEITPYGKSLLSMGRFMPVYYAFFDEDIVYDSECAGFVEHQNSASTRIKDAVQLETQAFFYSAGKQVKEATAFHRLTKVEQERANTYGIRPPTINDQPYVQADDVTIGTLPDKEFESMPLGNSAMNSSYAPAWNINVIEGEISSSAPVLPGLNLPIPQINMTASMFEFTLTDSPVGGNFVELYDAGMSPSNTLRDKFLNVIGKPIILEIDESNTNYEWENFDIEIFEVEERSFPEARPIGMPTVTGSLQVTKEFLRPLFFQKGVSQVENGILLDEDQIPFSSAPTDPRFSGYYFDINIDSEIDETILCGRARNKGDGLFSQRTLKCDEKDGQRQIGIKKLYEPDDGEDCPPGSGG